MKKKVFYPILEDMQKYVNGFDAKDYERTFYDTTDPSVVSFLRDYYEQNLPVDVTAWVRVNKPDASLKYSKGLDEQVHFVRDVICELVFSNFEEQKSNLPMVISTHISKSVKLPVYQIRNEKYGLEMILRYNFHNWKVSIKSESPLKLDFMGIFNPEEKVSEIYCEGFPNDKIYGCYKENESQFTISLSSEYHLFVFVFLLMKYLEI